MQRNTLLVVGILAVVAALVIGVNIGKKLSPASSPATPIPTPTQAVVVSPTLFLQTYVDTACGFSLQYTSDFTLIDSATGSAILNFEGDRSKSIVMTCQKSIPRPALTPDKEVSLTIPASIGASVSATLYHDQNASDGTPVDAVIFTHPTNKLDVFISGYGNPFNALIRTIQVIR